VNTHLNRALIKDFSWANLSQLIAEQRQNEAIELIRKYRITDLNAAKGLELGTQTVYVDVLDESGWIAREVLRSDLTILQQAVLSRSFKVVEFILSEYRVLPPGSKVLKGVDSRLITLNNV
jgi:hypothetical protein